MYSSLDLRYLRIDLDGRSGRWEWGDRRPVQRFGSQSEIGIGRTARTMLWLGEPGSSGRCTVARLRKVSYPKDTGK